MDYGNVYIHISLSLYIYIYTLSIPFSAAGLDLAAARPRGHIIGLDLLYNLYIIYNWTTYYTKYMLYNILLDLYIIFCPYYWT